MFVENTSRRHSCRLHVHLFCVSSVALMILQTISYIRVQNSCDRRPPKALKRKMFVVRSRLLICKEQYFSCTIKELYFRITIKQIHSLLHVYNMFVVCITSVIMIYVRIVVNYMACHVTMKCSYECRILFW